MPGTTSQVISAASVAGMAVRYSFYAAGAFVLIGMVIVPFFRSDPVKRIDAKPAFRLAAGDLSRLPTKTQVIAGKGARVELRQYGELHDRDKDFTLLMIMPPAGQRVARDLLAEMRDLAPLRYGAVLTSTYHDLTTRFGPVHAAEFRIDADGRRKLCLAYISRFDTSALYLKGWYCEASGIRAGPYDLACDIDSLVLDGPLASADADAFVRERIRHGQNCSAEPVSQTTDTRTYIAPARTRRY
jgi:hypothetical protein